jgi:hypothetical protein
MPKLEKYEKKNYLSKIVTTEGVKIISLFVPAAKLLAALY